MYIALTRGAFKSVNMKYFIMKIPMVKPCSLRPLEKITHARTYLKAQRSIGPAGFDREMVHSVFRRWYRCNDDKLALILRDSPDITIGDSGHYGSPCFQFDGVNV